MLIYMLDDIQEKHFGLFIIIFQNKRKTSANSFDAKTQKLLHNGTQNEEFK
jgi:hypothetical protein